MKRCIFHVDVNSAFLSWSAVKKLKEDPSALDLRTIPSAVGGDVKTRHGIITAKSIPAGRMGVKTGEPVVKALAKCPDLVLIPSDFETYRAYSRAFIRILEKYAPVIEQVSIDEAYLDMTGTEHLFRKESAGGEPFPLCAARVIRDEIRTSLGFTVNVGISTNKLLAKMASDFEKPDRTHTLYPEEVPSKMWPLPIRDLHGCGSATAARLYSLGILTIGDAAAFDEELLKSVLGEAAGAYIHRSANGISTSPVRAERDRAKSYSNERTLAEDITEDNYEGRMPEILDYLSDKVSGRLKKDHVRAATIGVIVKTGSFHRHTRQVTMERAVNAKDPIERAARGLMEDLLKGPEGLFAAGETLRLVGLSASGLDDSPFEQMSLFDLLEEQGADGAGEAGEKEEEMPFPFLSPLPSGTAVSETPPEPSPPDPAPSPPSPQEERKQRLEDMMKKVRSRYGEDALRKGSGPEAPSGNV